MPPRMAHPILKAGGSELDVGQSQGEHLGGSLHSPSGWAPPTCRAVPGIVTPPSAVMVALLSVHGMMPTIHFITVGSSICMVVECFLLEQGVLSRKGIA